MRGDVVDDPEQTRYPAEAVTLAIEVVSVESVSRDRETKPVKYARAGIGHYWRVENEKGLAVVHAFELEPTTGAYTSVGIFRERMKVSAPFPMDLDLTGIKTAPRRRVTPAHTAVVRHPCEEVPDHSRTAAVPRARCQRTNTPACPARSRKYCGATPSTTVTATPTAMAVIVSGDGTATVGPSGRGSLKNMSTITRM
ncbi:hypothetical protein SVIOM342S_02893 [Streptomyces violaceorubidus]